MKISFICTNYNSSVYTIECAESLRRISEDIDIIIIDNNSSETEKNLLKENLSSIQNLLIEFSDKNLGYFGGLNKGIEISRRKGVCDLLIIGNNDLLFNNSLLESLESIKKLFNKYPVISPAIFTEDGNPQNPHVIDGISNFRERVYDMYYSSYTIARIIMFISNITKKYTKRKDEIENFSKEGEIWQGYGACYFLTKKFFDEVGNYLWNPSFISFEEFFLSRQLELKGFKTYYTPNVMVTHRLHSSFKKISSKQKWKYTRDSFKIYRQYIKP